MESDQQNSFITFSENLFIFDHEIPHRWPGKHRPGIRADPSQHRFFSPGPSGGQTFPEV